MEDAQTWMERSLKELSHFLKKGQFTCLLTAKEESPQSQYLMVSLGEDAQNRNYVLQINYIPLPPPEEAGVAAYPFGNDVYMQFVVVLPFQIRKEQEHAVLKMLAQLNAALEIPGFGYNEVLQQLHFRYVYFSYEKKIHQGWLLALIVYIRTLLDLFASWIEELGQGKLSLQDITAKWGDLKLKDLSKEIKPLIAP